MARRNITTGIDIGTSKVRIVVAEYKDGSIPEIIGTGCAESKGLRHGYIVNTNEAVHSIKKAIREAEKVSGITIKKAFIAIGGLSLESEVKTSSVFVSRADNEVTEIDIQNAMDASEESMDSASNKQIIHAIPTQFYLDGENVLGRPVGMKGSRLEVSTLFVTCLTQHLNDFVQTVEEAGVQVEDIMASPIAASFVTLTKRQKTAGCVLANIGAETLSIVVFENNIPISLKIFPIGGEEITNDIALGFKIPLDEAENIKRGEGINSYPKKKLEEIVNARLSDIFDLINAHLKKIKKNGLLPAGIIITGGSSSIPFIEEFAKQTLKLPSKIAKINYSKNINSISDASWSVAYGLCIMGLDNEGEENIGMKLARKTKSGIFTWLKQFLP